MNSIYAAYIQKKTSKQNIQTKRRRIKVSNSRHAQEGCKIVRWKPYR